MEKPCQKDPSWKKWLVSHLCQARSTGELFGPYKGAKNSSVALWACLTGPPRGLAGSAMQGVNFAKGKSVKILLPDKQRFEDVLTSSNHAIFKVPGVGTEMIRHDALRVIYMQKE